jgi:sodium/pantothenate symporter
VLPFGALVSLVFFSKKFRQIGNHIQAKTLSQWIGYRYQHKGFATFFALLSLLLITFIVLILVGLTQIMSKALEVQPVWMLAAIVVFTFGYMMFGGANSMVYTNAVQAAIMLVVAIIILASGVDYFSGNTSFIAKLAAIDGRLVQAFNPDSPLYRDFFEVVVCQLLVGIAIVCQPHIITRSLLLKDEKSVNRYLITGVTVQTVFFLVIFAGLYARIDFPSLTYKGQPLPLDSVMSTWLLSKFPPFASLLLVLGMISAGISTLEGLIQSLSTSTTEDLLLPLVPSFQKNGLMVNRMVIVLLAVVSFYFSYRQLVAPDLSVGIFAQNGVYAFFSAALVPVFMGIFYKNVPAYIPFAAGVVALVTHFSVYYLRLTPYMAEGTRNPGIASALAIILAILTAGVLQALHTTKKKEVVL